MKPITQKNKLISKRESVNFQEVLSPYLKGWYIYVISILIALFSVYIYVKYSIPIYKNSASILINEDKPSSNQTGISVIEDIELVQSATNLMNELEIMKAHSVLEPVVDSICLCSTTYFIGNQSKLRRSELYETNPIKLKLFPRIKGEDFLPTSFFLSIYDSNLFEIEFLNGTKKKFKFGDIIELEDFSVNVIVDKNKHFSLYKNLGKKLEIVISPKEKTIAQLRSQLVIEKQNKESSVVTLSIQGASSVKNNAILNELIKSYQRDGLNDNNLIKTNTSNFVKERIKFLLEELDEVEKIGENYKTKTGIIDFQTGVNEYLTDKTFTKNNLENVSIQLSLVNLLIDYLNTSSVVSQDLLPSNLGFEDETINLMTDQYNKLVLEKKKLLQTTKESNPLVIKIDDQLVSYNESLKKSLRNLKKSYELKVNSYNRQYNKVNSELEAMPKFEREYRAILRQQQIKESLYLYLLQKREENEIELAASATNIKVIIPPINQGVLVAPQKSILNIIAFIIALLIPTGFIYIRVLFDNKIKSAKDFDDLTVIGQIPKGNKGINLIEENEKSFLSESLRMLRTNINFYLNDTGKSKVIAVSSTLPNEGKTFVSINLANSLSKAGYRVVVVGIDLRVPKLKDYVDLKDKIGVSNYIVDETVTPESIIRTFEDRENFFLINAGDIPPNPAELLLKPRFKELMTYLRNNFDFIILDTSPIGLISDCLPIVKNEADLLLYVARVGYLEKKLISIPQSYIDEGIVKNLAIVLNYIDPTEKRYSYKYGHGYTYGYTEDYFNESNTSWFPRLIKFFKKK
jgi:capsular exopolysaccharide synthesis family protein